MIRSVAISQALDRELTEHLIRHMDGQEDLAFACWFPSEGSKRVSALLHHAILPKDGERQVHG